MGNVHISILNQLADGLWILKKDVMVGFHWNIMADRQRGERRGTI